MNPVQSNRNNDFNSTHEGKDGSFQRSIISHEVNAPLCSFENITVSEGKEKILNSADVIMLETKKRLADKESQLKIFQRKVKHRVAVKAYNSFNDPTPTNRTTNSTIHKLRRSNTGLNYSSSNSVGIVVTKHDSGKFESKAIDIHDEETLVDDNAELLVQEPPESTIVAPKIRVTQYGQILNTGKNMKVDSMQDNLFQDNESETAGIRTRASAATTTTSLPNYWTKDLHKKEQARAKAKLRHSLLEEDRIRIKVKIQRQNRINMHKRNKEIADIAAVNIITSEKLRLEEELRVQAEREKSTRIEDERQEKIRLNKSLQFQRKHEETLRYISAMRARLADKIKLKNIDMPPLCNCHHDGSVIGHEWERCANNCVFYKNPKAYSKAIADLYNAVDLYI